MFPRARSRVSLLLVPVFLWAFREAACQSPANAGLDPAGEQVGVGLIEELPHFTPGGPSSSFSSPAKNPVADADLAEDVAYLETGTKQANAERQMQHNEAGTWAQAPPSSRVPVSLIKKIGVVAGAVLVLIVGCVLWEMRHLVLRAPDPIPDAETPEEAVAAIQDLLREGNTMAFVTSDCKYCGMGIKNLKRLGREPVVFLIGRHRFSEPVVSYLKETYDIKGFPTFFIDGIYLGGYDQTVQAYPV